jgi:hypothetical protein
MKTNNILIISLFLVFSLLMTSQVLPGEESDSFLYKNLNLVAFGNVTSNGDLLFGKKVESIEWIEEGGWDYCRIQLKNIYYHPDDYITLGTSIGIGANFSINHRNGWLHVIIYDSLLNTPVARDFYFVIYEPSKPD